MRRLLLAALLVPAAGHVALAADLELATNPVEITDALPAVSGPNVKIELNGGTLALPDPSALYEAGASLSVPVGPSFGLQGDLAVRYSNDRTTYGGTLHAFTRDPSSYLLGMTGAVIWAPEGMIAAVGPEAELYLDRVSIEAWAGYGKLDYEASSLSDVEGGFAFLDAALYPTDDLRLTIGASYVLDQTALHAAAEYQFSDTPFSVAADLRYDLDDDWKATLGLKGYFGGESKTLIDRHRQDDPRNRALDLTAAAEPLWQEAEADAPPSNPIDTDAECQVEFGAGYYWDEVNQRCSPS